MAYSHPSIKSLLTIWIPTFNRKKELTELLGQIKRLGISKYINVIVSDNSSTDFNIDMIESNLLEGITIQKRSLNLSAGANFMRCFEHVSTKWVHIVGDDDLLNKNYIEILSSNLKKIDNDVCAIKFDSTLYGSLHEGVYTSLDKSIEKISSHELNDWFNNLLFISGWVFNVDIISKYVKYAYLGYGTKLGHIVPALKACDEDSASIYFTPDRPVHFYENEHTWPKAATWVEMVLYTQLSHDILSTRNRIAIYKCLFNGSALKLFAKILRIRLFYNKNSTQCWLTILQTISVISKKFMLFSLLMLPFLILPDNMLPKALRLRLGPNGSTERW